MMTVPMDNSLAPSSRELAERLYKKNVELETTLRNYARSRVPSDPNAWFQIRENYETIILEDHDFSEKHEVELALWQLHYRRIEEFRTLLNTAKSAGSVTSQGGRTPSRSDSIKKIRSGFKTFLSESTGFYHDLILKIRAKFGLPLGFFSDGPGNQTILTKDEKRSAAMKKGLMSCHRCLIYLGDLARYKGSYGEGDSISREYAAASGYYKQATSICPSTGNPHHQLAILASYSGDDLVSIYRYFRSLAAVIPFSTARDNLIIAFEKNRQSFSQLPANSKVVVAKMVAARSTRKGRGREDARVLAKASKPEAMPVRDLESSIPEVLKTFSTRFVRVNGILFTQTSLETFGEIFESVKSDFLQLLSAGPEEELNFGQDAAENGLFLVRLIAILIFTVHNVNKESNGQSYAEILQRTVVLQNAFTAAFECSGDIIRRCVQLHDAASSFLVPAILMFIEWLACHPDIAAGSDVEEKQVSARSFFWTQFVTFMNKLLSSGLISGDGNEDETCFSDMSQYDEGETGNRLALWEDFELRGFLPLVPAQQILDFSREHAFGKDGMVKKKQARAQRILAAGRALMNVVRVEQKAIYFDPCLKKFVIGIEPPAFDGCMRTGLSVAPKLNVTTQTYAVEKTSNYGMMQQKAPVYIDGEEEEEIVFKPSVGEKYPSVGASTSLSTAHETIQPAQLSRGAFPTTSMSSAYETIQPAQISTEKFPTTSISTAYEKILPANISTIGEWAIPSISTAHDIIQPSKISSNGEWVNCDTQLSATLGNFQMPTSLHASLPLDAAGVNFSQQPLQHMNLNSSKWITEQAVFLANGLKNFNVNGNGYLSNLQGALSSLPSTAFAFSPLFSSSQIHPISRSSGQSQFTEAYLPATLDSMSSGLTSENLAMKSFGALPSASRRTPISRPVKHLGRPPGFSNTRSKQLDDFSPELINGQNPQADDYSWLDGYQRPSSKALEVENSGNHVVHKYQNSVADNITELNGAMSFPFPGKQISSVQTQMVNEKLSDFQLFGHRNLHSEQQLQQASFQPSMMPERHQAQSPLQQASFQPSMMPERHQAQSLWSGYLV